MNIIKSGLLIMAIGMLVYSCKPKGFTRLKSGIEYSIIHDEKGDKKAVEGSSITMHIITKAGDSVIFNSRTMNNNEAVPLQIAKPQYNGDIMEGFALLTEGDSAHFKICVDSIFREGQLPPFVKKGDMIDFFVKMISVKSPEEQKELANKQGAIDEELITKYLTSNNITATKTASGLYYSISKAGTGANAQPGQQVTMNYTGKLMDGTVFDSNQDPKFGHTEPFTFQLGAGQVIKGWDEGIALLNNGSKATLLIPSTLAYGSQAMPGNPNNEKGIPANSVLIFDVEVLGAKELAVK